MRVKSSATKARQPRIKVVMVKQGERHITHIYRSRECFKLDELARYKRKAFKTLAATTSESAIKEEEENST